MKTPAFWQKHFSIFSLGLFPIGIIYGLIVFLRKILVKPKKLPIPVICVGNLTMGGAGKTPTVIALVEILRQMGYSPHILSRGYGGSIKVPVRVDASCHTPSHVGDESLLLTRVATTWIGGDRYASGTLAIEAGADILIMDDGLQNPHLYKDIRIGVFDQKAGLGNGWIFPSGPLREFRKMAVKELNLAILVNYESAPNWITCKTVFGRIAVTEKPDVTRSYVAFCGIGAPEKFFTTLKEHGVRVVRTRVFPDHYNYTSKDEKALEDLAKEEEGSLITTEKDAIKLSPLFRKKVTVLPISLSLCYDQLSTILHELIRKTGRHGT